MDLVSAIDRSILLNSTGRRTADRTLPALVAEHRASLLRMSVLVLAAAAAGWLGYQGWRLLLLQGYWGAIDLGNYHRLVADWFEGRPIYLDRTAVHPPATYLLMWPFVGWLSFEKARWLWGATSALALAALVRLGLRAAAPDESIERRLIALIVLGTYPAGATIGNGQLGLHVLLALASAFLLVERSPPLVQHDLVAGGLLCLALVKPTLSAPFLLWLAVRPRGLRSVLFAIAGYLAATWGAMAARPETPTEIVRGWLASPGLGQRGTANLQAWLRAVGHLELARGAALGMLVGLAWWLLRHRRSRALLVLPVVAITARLFTYHRWYDDLLILVPLLALYRFVRREGAERLWGRIAGALFVLTTLAMVAPGGHYILPPPWKQAYLTVLVALWLAMLAFFASRAEIERGRALRSQGWLNVPP